MTVRAVIVEDEPMARQVLREFVSEVDWLEAVGEAKDGRSAVELIDELAPDLVFLDVRMPELSGLEVLKRVRHEPAVVFTTAYDRYAVAAFELEAIDYLIKPFGRKRFRATLERVRRRLAESAALPGVRDRAQIALSEGPLKRLFARQADRIVPIPIDSVTRVDAADDYCEVHSRGQTYLLNLTLAELESRLDGERFLRVHRSHIVNLDAIDSIRPHDERRLVVILRDGTKVVASRSGSQRLREMST